jgi:hypothetical protein
MARRSTPERLDAAHRAGVRNRLMGEGMSEELADAWFAAWDDQAASEGVERGSGYWDRAYDWIAAERMKRPRP